MQTSRTLVDRFLESRGLTEPNGQPLYRYHTRSGELAELRDILSRELDGPLGPWTAMAFCLWASEWWHRNYVAGPWKWEPLLTDLDHTEFAPGEPRYGNLQDLVTRGLYMWGRSVLRVGVSRGFLVTLACEGGLPMGLVLREHTHLRAFLKGVLEEFRLFGATGIPSRDLAERVRDRLPRGLRQQVVYELTGELIQQVWQLQQQLGDTSTPVKDLDQRHHGWRDRLPVRVTDRVARTLLNGLLLDAAEVARGGRIGVRWVVELAPTGEEDWETRGSLHVPATIDSLAFNKLFGRDPEADVPHRFDLSLKPEGDTLRPIALATKRRTAEEGRYFGIDLLPAALSPVIQDLTRPRRLVARTPGEAWETDQYPGATGLSDLPWVFIAKDPEAGIRQTCRLAGQGSVRLREPWALVAVDADTVVEPADGGKAKVSGVLQNGARRVHRISGKVVFRALDGSRSEVETSAESGTINIEYRLHGQTKLLGRGAFPVFLGGTTMQEWRDGEFQGVVSERHLQWKPDIPGGTWQPYSLNTVDSGLVLGSGLIRYVQAGVVRHSVRICVLPKRADVEVHPSPDPARGELRLCGFGRIEAAVTAPSTVSTIGSTDDFGYCLELNASDEVPDDVTVVVDWPRQGRAILPIPFPAKRAAFVAASGCLLPCESDLADGSVAGVRAEVVVPTAADFAIHGLYVGNDAAEFRRPHGMFVREIPHVSVGHYMLDLAMVQPAIAQVLSLSDDLDGAVRLWIHSNEMPGSLAPTNISVRRFDLGLEVRDDHTGLIGLDVSSQQQVSTEDLANLEVEALPLLDPDLEPVALSHCADDAWLAPKETMAPGPYLIVGRQGDWQRARPMIWRVGAWDLELGSDSPAAVTVATAYASGVGDGRERFTLVAHELGEDPDHPDWPLVFAYLRETSLPVRAFHLLRALAEMPSVCALAATISSARDFDILWERMKAFSFAWWQISLPCWEGAFEAYADHCKMALDVLDDTELARRMFEDEVTRRIDRVTGYLDGLGAALGFLRARLLGIILPKDTSRIADPNMLGVLRQQYIEHRSTCPALGPNGPDLPRLSGFHKHAIRLQDDHPWSKSIFVPRVGRFAAHQRANVADAPALTAVMVLIGGESDRQLAKAMREARAYDPSWFDEALRLAQLIAFGSREAERIQKHLREDL